MAFNIVLRAQPIEADNMVDIEAYLRSIYDAHMEPRRYKLEGGLLDGRLSAIMSELQEIYVMSGKG